MQRYVSKYPFLVKPSSRALASSLPLAREEIRVRLSVFDLADRAGWPSLESKIMRLEDELTAHVEPPLGLCVDVIEESIGALRAVLSGFSPGSQHERRANRVVAQIMTTDVRVCRPEDTLESAAWTMWEANCGGLPVVDAEGRPLGFVTDRDICMGALTQGVKLAESSVQSAMAKELHTCGVDESVVKVLDRMQSLKVRRMPAVDATGRLRGIVTLGDVAREVEHAAPSMRPLNEETDVSRTLAAISEPLNPRH